MQTKVTIKLTEPMIGDSDVCILNANEITLKDGLLMVMQRAEDPLLVDFASPTEEIIGIFRCEDVRAIWRTISK